MAVDPWMWAAFLAVIGVLLAVDLLVVHRGARELSLRGATLLSVVWIALGVGFGAVLWAWRGPTVAGEYFAVYLLERALSFDNIFVFALLFAYFGVEARYQHRLLFWGVLAALMMRGGFIVLGAELLERYHWVIYIFGALLVVTGIRMATQTTEQLHPDRNPFLRLLRRSVPMTTDYHGRRFWLRADRLTSEQLAKVQRPALLGVWVATPLLGVLVAVETADVAFAIDSIPAAFGVTSDTFVVFTSNAFALLGMRAMYFMLSGAMDRFAYLRVGLALILGFVAAKFLLHDVVGEIPILISLAFIAATIAASIGASLRRHGRGPNPGGSTGRRPVVDASQ